VQAVFRCGGIEHVGVSGRNHLSENFPDLIKISLFVSGPYFHQNPGFGEKSVIMRQFLLLYFPVNNPTPIRRIYFLPSSFKVKEFPFSVHLRLRRTSRAESCHTAGGQ
jgi:hypothetical protein